MNTETTSALDLLVASCTSFATWAALEAAMVGGYVPSIIVYAEDGVALSAAKVAVAARAERAGFRVFRGHMHAKTAAARAAYAAARARCMSLKGRVLRAGSTYRTAHDVPGYAAASDALTAARKALRALEASVA